MASFTLHDGSCVRKMSAKELAGYEVWKGNRIIDLEHVKQIKESVGDKVSQLDFGYRIVRFPSTDAAGRPLMVANIVDGQHRHAVLKEYFASTMCAEDFEVVVIEKTVETETDIIEYFNTLNNVKPITWTDTNLVVNLYVEALEQAFNRHKLLLIRPGSTHRPYLSSEKLREALTPIAGRLRMRKTFINAWVERVVEHNTKKLAEADMVCLSVKKSEGDLIQRAAKLGFMLALDPRMRWVSELTFASLTTAPSTL
jgi:hypothetical protein